MCAEELHNRQMQGRVAELLPDLPTALSIPLSATSSGPESPTAITRRAELRDLLRTLSDTDPVFLLSQSNNIGESISGESVDAECKKIARVTSSGEKMAWLESQRSNSSSPKVAPHIAAVDGNGSVTVTQPTFTQKK
eukprot:SAG31_NODE_21019_length_559_cov_1.352174_2_plen_136_part_01